MRQPFHRDVTEEEARSSYESMRPLLVLLVGCCAAGCSDLGFDVRSLTDLEKARARWERESLGPYVYAVERLCYCPVESMGPVRVVVAGSSVTRTYVDTGDPVPPSMEHLFPTVEGLFDILREAYAEEAEEVRVTYDEDFGFPADFWIDYEEMMADEELGMRVTEDPVWILFLDTAAATR
jgi:hypothetical protein